MTTEDRNWPPAFDPFTPRGVAAFAGASWGRLALAQLLVASLAAASVVWFLHADWFPVVKSALQQLPPQGQISHERLDWQGEPSVQLAQNPFLGIAVDLYHSGRLGREAHLQIEFGVEDLRVYSLLGYEIIFYPEGWTIPFNQTELEPWWGAWQPAFLAGAAAVVVPGLMLSWLLLATVYCAPVKLISFLENRDLNWGESWRLAGAAMMPGALFMTACIIAYSLNFMDLIGLGVMLALHFAIAWVYLFIAPLFCPRPPEVKKAGKNPFAAPKVEDQ
jgi:hypothetical protein